MTIIAESNSDAGDSGNSEVRHPLFGLNIDERNEESVRGVDMKADAEKLSNLSQI